MDQTEDRPISAFRTDYLVLPIPEVNRDCPAAVTDALAPYSTAKYDLPPRIEGD